MSLAKAASRDSGTRIGFMACAPARAYPGSPAGSRNRSIMVVKKTSVCLALQGGLGYRSSAGVTSPPAASQRCRAARRGPPARGGMCLNANACQRWVQHRGYKPEFGGAFAKRYGRLHRPGDLRRRRFSPTIRQGCTPPAMPLIHRGFEPRESLTRPSPSPITIMSSGSK